MSSQLQPSSADNNNNNNNNDVMMSNAQTTPQISGPDQDFATMFAEFMGSSPIHILNSHMPLELGAGTQPEAHAPLGQPGVSGEYNLPTSSPTSEARLREMKATIDVQIRHLLELQALVKRLQEQCTYYKDKAVTFKALYTQQQALSESTMTALVQLRHRQGRSGGFDHKSFGGKLV
ncbi:hypothetical protein BKA70DRAFT_1241292 [Coprinopsis sp. MPI-PUGE-AT-0042]|nr:hypothetical protein BKA70DRAFT_1241292 [Coprinopsis sp. MPI-PUGE-AT-0042]